MTIPFVKDQKVKFHCKVGGVLTYVEATAEEGGWTGMARSYKLRFTMNGSEVVKPVPGKNIFIVFRKED